jgi:hypothetical protein
MLDLILILMCDLKFFYYLLNYRDGAYTIVPLKKKEQIKKKVKEPTK